MSIQQGQKAPDFSLFDDDKQLFKLLDHEGKQNVVLLFFPGAFTSPCTTELSTVNNDLEAYGGEGTRVVGVSTDSPFVLAEFKKVNGFQFTLLSDHNAAVSSAYGAKYNQDFTPMKLDRIAKRSAFVIDKSGYLQYVEVLENAGEMPDLERVKQVVAKLG